MTDQTPTTNPTGTCQICGRSQKVVRGRIAIHGYRQPWLTQGDGARTASCAGSRHLPYEVSRDAIPTVRDGYAASATATRAMIAEWLATPPAKLHVVKRDAWGNVKRDVNLELPADFDPNQPAHYKFGLNYESEFASRVRSMRDHATGLEQTVEFLNARYAAWKAVAA